MVAIYDSNGVRRMVTLEEYIVIQAQELERLLEMSKHDPA